MDKRSYLVSGYRHGFCLGHDAPLNSVLVESRCSEEELAILREKIQKEMSLGRIAGPYKEPPFEPYQCFL